MKVFLICHVHSILQLEDGVVDLFTNSVKENGLLIDMEVPERPKSLMVYIEGWHHQLWDQAFLGFFKGKDAYTRSKAFQDQKLTDLTVKRAVYRYAIHSHLAVHCTFKFFVMILL